MICESFNVKCKIFGRTKNKNLVKQLKSDVENCSFSIMWPHFIVVVQTAMSISDITCVASFVGFQQYQATFIPSSHVVNTNNGLILFPHCLRSLNRLPFPTSLPLLSDCKLFVKVNE